MPQVVPLQLLAAGERGRVFDVDGHRDLVTRLAEMGLREGVEIEMLQPGCPCIIAVQHHRLSFRGEEAQIFVETSPAQDPP